MISAKIEAIEILKSLPDNCTWEDIQYHLYVREKVEKGLKDIENGKIVSHEKVEKEVNEWLKFSGQNQH